MPKLLYTHSCIRRAHRFAKRHPELLSQYQKTLKLLEANPTHPSLALHKLSGNLVGLYSVSINKSYRISLEFVIQDDTIVPVDVGTHDEIYRSREYAWHARLGSLTPVSTAPLGGGLVGVPQDQRAVL